MPQLEGRAGQPPHDADFSLVLGGPLFQLLRRAHLSDDALMMVRQRIVVISLLAWLPLLLLAALEGHALGGSTAVPFLFDVEVHIRYLLVLPLLIAAELVVAVMLVFVLALVAVPLLFFAPQLAQAKRVGLREYGTLSERYVREFDAKWLRGGAPAGEALVGSGDVQSLADMGGRFEMVRTMLPAPVTKEMIFQLAMATLAPIVPLALTMMPLEELLKRLVGVIL